MTTLAILLFVGGVAAVLWGLLRDHWHDLDIVDAVWPLLLGGLCVGASFVVFVFGGFLP